MAKNKTDPPDEAKPVISIGDFELSSIDEASFWLQRSDGEGAQVNLDVLEASLDDLWDEVF